MFYLNLFKSFTDSGKKNSNEILFFASNYNKIFRHKFRTNNFNINCNIIITNRIPVFFTCKF